MNRPSKGDLVEVRFKIGAGQDCTASTTPYFFPSEETEQGPISHVGYVCEVKEDRFYMTPGWDNEEKCVAEVGHTGGIGVYYEAIHEMQVLRKAA